uniref:V-set and immunoglobulin domain containing 2 n=1 Tax=Terrapene triunguis TaxID=2587831 RepID=A0A674IJM9_9SAUR
MRLWEAAVGNEQRQNGRTHSLSSTGAGPCVEVTVPQDPVMQERGSSVEFPCHYKTSVDKNFMLEWRFAPASIAPEQILYFTNDKLYKPGSQAERLSLLDDPPTTGDATLQLANIRASDNGTYICEVNNPPDFYGSGSGLIHFTVLMPPSTPVCKGTEYARIGSDATLTCSSVEGVPAPIYTWSRVDSKTSLPLANMVQGRWRVPSLIDPPVQRCVKLPLTDSEKKGQDPVPQTLSHMHPDIWSHRSYKSEGTTFIKENSCKLQTQIEIHTAQGPALSALFTKNHTLWNSVPHTETSGG